MATTYLKGRVDVSLNGVTIPAQYISGDDGVVTTLTESSAEISTMAGTFNLPNGIYEESTVTFSVVLPNFNYLKHIFPDMYTASSDRPSVAGQIAFGGDECTVRENTPVVVHYTCDENSDNDIFVPNGSVQANVEITQNAEDAVMVEITVQALPSDDHNGQLVIVGTGDLGEPTLWDPATETYEPISS